MGISLTQPPVGSTNWGTQVNANWAAIQGARAVKNALINSNFNLWQRGTSFTAIATNTCAADRMKYYKNGTMVHTISQDTNVPTVAQSGILSNYSLKLACTTAEASLGVSDYALIGQNIEGYNWLPFAQKVFTLSFWVMAAKTGTYCVAFRNSAGDRCYVAEYTINAANTWQFVTITVSASPNAGTWNYTNGIGLQLVWTIAAKSGGTYQTTANVWNTGNFLNTANQVNGVDSTSDNFWLAQIQLEEGNAATPLEYVNIQQELTMCQRYCYVVNSGIAANQVLVTGYVASATNISWLFTLPVAMRVVPALTCTATDWQASDISFSGVFDANSVSIASSGNNGGIVTDRIFMFGTKAGATWGPGRAAVIYCNGTNKIMIFDAEL